MNIQLTLKEFCMITNLLGCTSAQEYNDKLAEQFISYSLTNTPTNENAPLALQLIRGNVFRFNSDDLGNLYNKLDDLLLDSNNQYEYQMLYRLTPTGELKISALHYADKDSFLRNNNVIFVDVIKQSAKLVTRTKSFTISN